RFHRKNLSRLPQTSQVYGGSESVAGADFIVDADLEMATPDTALNLEKKKDDYDPFGPYPAGVRREADLGQSRSGRPPLATWDQEGAIGHGPLAERDRTLRRAPQVVRAPSRTMGRVPPPLPRRTRSTPAARAAGAAAPAGSQRAADPALRSPRHRAERGGRDPRTNRGAASLLTRFPPRRRLMATRWSHVCDWCWPLRAARCRSTGTG